MMNRLFRRFVLPALAFWLYRLWSATWRVSVFEPPQLKSLMASDARLIFAHWHGDELAIIRMVTGYRIATMTSTSDDGTLVDYIIRHLGGATARGSSTRGGISALKGLIRLMSQGYRASMAVDGPKGPLHQVKPGVFELSRLADAYVVPMGIECHSEFVFRKSWNKARLPKPFARVSVAFGEPWPPITRELDPRAMELQTKLGTAISDARHQATKIMDDFR